MMRRLTILLAACASMGMPSGPKAVANLEPTTGNSAKGTVSFTQHGDAVRVIAQGLKPDEWVVVGALQQVRPRMQVEPERSPMPSLDQPTGGEAPSPGPRAPTSHPAGQPGR